MTREEILEGLYEIKNWKCNGDAKLHKVVIEAIKALEQEPKTGHWIEIAKYSDGKHKIECSECGSHIFDRGHANSFNVKNKYKYCPNCGCHMIEPQESEE